MCTRVAAIVFTLMADTVRAGIAAALHTGAALAGAASMVGMIGAMDHMSVDSMAGITMASEWVLKRDPGEPPVA
jgi:hypothetical protein